MTEEVKKILNNFIKIVKKPTYTKETYDGNLATLFKTYTLETSEVETLLNYITNLQKENEEFYQLMEMQNKREYRSKFLKDFQKEHGKNVFPDYDEVYKRYDDYKSRNEKAVELLKRIQEKYGYMLEDVIFLLLQGGDE